MYDQIATLLYLFIRARFIITLELEGKLNFGQICQCNIVLNCCYKLLHSKVDF